MESDHRRKREAPKCRYPSGALQSPPLILIGLTPHAQVPKAPTDALRALESTTTAVVAAIMAEQAASGGLNSGGPVTLSLPASPDIRPTVTLPARTVTLSELQRLKRQFVTVHKKAITLGTTEKGAVDWGEEGVADKFVRYVEENLRA